MQSMIRRSDLRQDIAVFKTLIAKDVTSATELENNLNGIYRAIRAIRFENYDLGKHRTTAPDLMADVFGLQNELRERITRWHNAGVMSRDAQKAARDVLRAARYAGDYLGELWINHERLDADRKTLRAFTGANNNTLVSTRFAFGGDVPFRSGDVILTRGRLYNSAAIARIGDIDSQFSHVAMVYINADGEHFAVESVIEEGARVTPLHDLLADDLVRAIVFRHRDKNLAQRAAYLIHERVQHSRSRNGKRIWYDFTMQLDNRLNLFCSKLVRRAFKEASAGELILPSFKTKLDMQNRDFPDRIGVTALETFAPGDIELEPDFDIVAEWQDYRATSDIRLQDITMDKMFEWMERDNFRFRETFLIKLLSMFGRGATYLIEPLQNMVFSLFPKIPPNMSRRAVAAIAMLNATGQEILEKLRAQDEASIRNTGLPMHPDQIREELDKIHEASPNEIGYLRRTPR